MARDSANRLATRPAGFAGWSTNRPLTRPIRTGHIDGRARIDRAAAIGPAYGARMRILASVSVVFAVSLISPDGARAGGFGIPEIGARRTAMAAVVGRPDEPTAVFHNPAGLSLLRGVHLYATMGEIGR